MSDTPRQPIVPCGIIANSWFNGQSLRMYILIIIIFNWGMFQYSTSLKAKFRNEKKYKCMAQ